MNRVDRLVGILTVLQSRKYSTAEKIAEKFDISVRTVYRDIKALGEIGIPVSFENNKGYFIVSGYFLPPVSFSTEEANALVLITSLAERFADKTTAKYSSQALDKIRSVLRSSDREKSEKLVSRIKVLSPHSNDNKYLSEVQDAISTNIILHITYTDLKNAKSQREIEPIGMLYYTDQWHIIAWCWQRHDYRDFIVKRINTLTNTMIPFRKHNHITIEDHILKWN
ncbi:MAG: YafY family protein [Cyclobacteriaceae bacterium]